MSETGLQPAPFWEQCVHELKIRHSKNGPARFTSEAAPALETYASASPAGFIKGIQAAKAAIVANDHDERRGWLDGRGFTAPTISKILESVENEEGHPAASVWDMVQGITAVARSIPNTNDRVAMERAAGKLLTSAARAA